MAANEDKKDKWDKLEIFSKLITGGLLVVIAFFIDKGAQRISRSNEEGKIIQSLIEDLSKKDDDTHNDVALLSLEKFLLQKNGKYISDIDKSYVLQVAETLLRQRIAQDSAFKAQSSIPFKLWQKYDSAGSNAFFSDFFTGRNNFNKIPPIDSSRFDSTYLANEVNPVAQSKDASEASVIGSLKKRIVYLQYSRRLQLDTVKQLQSQLIQSGWIAPGFEFVSGRYSDIVKYFNDNDREIANEAAGVASRIFNRRFKTLSNISNKYHVPRGQIEIWVGAKY